jgi:hypothetical protein
MKIDPRELETVLIPGKRPPLEATDSYLKAYHYWRQVTGKGEGETFISDDFTAQEEILAFFYRGECTCVCFVKSSTSKFYSITVDSRYSQAVSGVAWESLVASRIQLQDWQWVA